MTQTQIRTYKSVFDVFDDIFEMSRGFNKSNPFPPHNIYVSEDEKQVVWEFALAGCKKEDISVEVNDGVLLVSGKSGNENISKSKKVFMKGFADRNFQIRYCIPKGCDEEPIAQFENGVLTVSFNLTTNSTKKVEIR